MRLSRLAAPVGFLAVVAAGCASGQGRSSQPDPAQTFLSITAAHVCRVQATSFQTPAAMAKAYAKRPDYPGLSAAQVVAFQRRLGRDAAFARALARHVDSAC